MHTSMRERQVEDQPRLDVTRLVDRLTRRHWKRGAGSLHIGRGLHVEWRLDLASRVPMLTLRVEDRQGNPWVEHRLQPHPLTGFMAAECPWQIATGCERWTQHIHYPLQWAATGRQPVGCCMACGSLYYATAIDHSDVALIRADIRAHNYAAVAEVLQGGGIRAMRAIKAIEAEGLVENHDRLFTLEDGHVRRWEWLRRVKAVEAEHAERRALKAGADAP